MATPSLCSTKRHPESDDDEQLLQCSICLDLPSSESSFIQCRNGHLLCSDHVDQTTSCPVCRYPMDPTNPVYCLYAKQQLERLCKKRKQKEVLLLKCRGCDWTGMEKAKLAAHERQCTAALSIRIQDMQKQLTDEQHKTTTLSVAIEEMQNQQAKRKESPPEESQSNQSPAVSAAAWWTCVELYKTDPLPGAELFVAPSNETKHPTWIRLHCAVPGTGYLEGAQLEFTAEYHPLTWRAYRIRRLPTNQVFYLANPDVQVSLAQLLRAMQQFALCMDVPESDMKARQYERRAEAFEAAANSMALRSSEFVSLETSQTMLSLFAVQPKSTETWHVEKDCCAYPLLDPIKNGSISVPKQNHFSGPTRPSKKLRVDNLPYFSRLADVRKLFTDAGFNPTEVEKACSTKYHKIDYGYATLRTYGDAMKALEKLKGSSVNGRPVSISSWQ